MASMKHVRTTRRQPEAPARRDLDDRGSVIPEFAFVVPILVLLFLGIFEFGMAFRADSGVSSAVRLANRTNTNQSPSRLADLNSMLALRAGMVGQPNTLIDYAIVYKGVRGSNSSPPPASCIAAAEALSVTATSAAGVSNLCNIYTRGTLDSRLIQANFNGNPNCDANDFDRYYCPRGRSNTVATPDVVGIYVKATYTTQTGVLPSTNEIELKDFSTMRVEPNPS